MSFIVTVCVEGANVDYLFHGMPVPVGALCQRRTLIKLINMQAYGGEKFHRTKGEKLVMLVV